MLFQHGYSKLHSGVDSDFKIDCDYLTDEDIETLAWLINLREVFHEVHGIPMGGLRLANALQKYVYENAKNILIVDDVLTTGRSMEEERSKHINKGFHISGTVIFCRNKWRCPRWVKPIFQMWS